MSKQIRIVNEKGHEIRPTGAQKDAIYRHAKELRKDIKDRLITRSEGWKPSDENVQKFIKQENTMQGKVREYKQCMESLDGDPKARNTEKFRKR